MKEYRDLMISGTRDQLLATAAEIERMLNDGWQRKKQTEEQTRQRAGVATDQLIFCFACTPKMPRKGALLVLMSNHEGNLGLTNIVPDEMGRLTYDEFNLILEEFLKKFAIPASKTTGVTIEASSGIFTIEDWLSPDTAEKLRQFLEHSHGSRSRPEDERLWNSFLISAHRENAKIGDDVLRRWLSEYAGCDEYIADELASDYRRSQEILSFEEQYQGA